MKKCVSFIMVVLILMFLFACEQKVEKVDLINAVEAKYDIKIEKVYTSVKIDPRVGEEDHFVHFTKEMERQLKKVHQIVSCVEEKWLNVAYIKSEIGDHLVFFVDFVKSTKYIQDAVIMIDFPYIFTAEVMYDYLLNLELDEPLLIDFEQFEFRFQFEHERKIEIQYSFFDRMLKKPPLCFSLDVSLAPSFNYNFFPSAFSKSEFAWTFLVEMDEEEENETVTHSNLWFTVVNNVSYRIWVDHGTVYITFTKHDVEEHYIYPHQGPLET